MNSRQRTTETRVFERHLPNLDGEDLRWLAIAFARLKALCESKIS